MINLRHFVLANVRGEKFILKLHQKLIKKGIPKLKDGRRVDSTQFLERMITKLESLEEQDDRKTPNQEELDSISRIEFLNWPDYLLDALKYDKP